MFTYFCLELAWMAEHVWKWPNISWDNWNDCKWLQMTWGPPRGEGGLDIFNTNGACSVRCSLEALTIQFSHFPGPKLAQRHFIARHDHIGYLRQGFLYQDEQSGNFSFFPRVPPALYFRLPLIWGRWPLKYCTAVQSLAHWYFYLPKPCRQVSGSRLLKYLSSCPTYFSGCPPH